MRRGGEHVRRREFCDLFARDVLEPTIALAASRMFEGGRRTQTEAVEDLRQLVLETFRTDQHCPRSGGGELAVASQQPAPLETGLLGEQAIVRPRFQKDGVEAEEPQPTRQRTEHRVA